MKNTISHGKTKKKWKRTGKVSVKNAKDSGKVEKSKFVKRISIFNKVYDC